MGVMSISSSANRTAVLLLWLGVAGCAQISSPTGGPVDEDPPEVLAMTPPTDEVEARPGSLRILFDEFVSLKSAQQQLIISPPISKRPTIKVRGKEVRVEMDPNAFEDSTTYVFSFGGGIVDLHESNPALDLNWAFSTGSEMDSLELKGRVTDRMSGGAMEGLRVLLFQEPIELDSILAGTLPAAIGVTDATGLFRIDYLKDGQFFALVLDDANANYRWDEGEYLAFDTIPMVAGDTLVRAFSGFEPKKPTPLRYIESSKIDSVGSIRIYAPLDGESVVEEWGALIMNQRVEAPWERTLDSVFMWVDQGIIGDGSSIQVVWNGESFTDTANVRLDRNSRRQTPQVLGALPRTSRAQNVRSLTFDRAVEVTDDSLWMLVRGEDTLAFDDFSIRLDSLQSVGRTLQLHHRETVNEEYSLTAFPGAFGNPLGQVQDDTLMWSWKTHPLDHFGELNVALTNLPGSGWLVIESSKGALDRFRVLNDTTIIFSQLLPGVYQLGFELDVNEDDAWQMGNLSRLEVPEPYFYPGENPTIRSNWMVEWAWDFSLEADTK
jgi:hypothetical protein